MITLARLYIHPVKSLRGLQLSHAQVSSSGLAFDRTFMITDVDGTFITARQYPQMVLFTPALLANGLFLTAPDGVSAAIHFSDFATAAQPTEVRGNHFTALIAPAEDPCGRCEVRSGETLQPLRVDHCQHRTWPQASER